MKIEDRIASSRKLAGFTQKELAKQISVTVQTMVNFESKVPPTATRLFEIADVVGVDYAWLYAGEGSSNKEKTTAYNKDKLSKIIVTMLKMFEEQGVAADPNQAASLILSAYEASWN